MRVMSVCRYGMRLSGAGLAKEASNKLTVYIQRIPCQGLSALASVVDVDEGPPGGAIEFSRDRRAGR